MVRAFLCSPEHQCPAFHCAAFQQARRQASGSGDGTTKAPAFHKRITVRLLLKKAASAASRALLCSAAKCRVELAGLLSFSTPCVIHKGSSAACGALPPPGPRPQEHQEGVGPVSVHSPVGRLGVGRGCPVEVVCLSFFRFLFAEISPSIADQRAVCPFSSGLTPWGAQSGTHTPRDWDSSPWGLSLGSIFPQCSPPRHGLRVQPYSSRPQTSFFFFFFFLILKNISTMRDSLF